MNPKLLWLLTAILIISLQRAGAQQPTKIPAIGYLIIAPLNKQRSEAFRNGLRELGYIEGKNIVIEWRSANGKWEQGPALAKELVRLNMDVIVTAGGGGTRVVKEVTSTIPIVMTQSDDPGRGGLVASLARPGGNITGLSQLSPELSGKRLEILKEVLAKLSRLAVLGTSRSPGNAGVLKEIHSAGTSFNVTIQCYDVLNADEIEPAFRTAGKARADAVLVLISGPFSSPYRRQLAELGIKTRLPVMHERAEYVEAGGLMSYGVHLADLDRRAAAYVDKILRGAKPADLPVEQPTKFELAINLRTAKQIGLTIPPNVLARADKVIR